MLLSELMKDWPCTLLQGSIRQTVLGITESSKRVEEGFVFIVRKGTICDGMEFIKEALEKGANTIVVDRVDLDLSYIPKEITVLRVPDSTLFVSYGSAKLAGFPGEELEIIAVTGTNGKTTVSHFIGQLLEAVGCRTAVIGTTGIYLNGVLKEHVQDSMTTMPAERLHPILRDCVDQKVTHVILEASSLGLSSNRLAHCPISVGILLNVGIDHYAEHGGKQQYIEAKKQLIRLAKKMIVNEDDPICCDMCTEMASEPTYFSSAHINRKPYTANELNVPVLGKHNEMNARAAICALLSLGYSFEEIHSVLSVLHLPSGRLQRFYKDGIEVYVDYAHTPDALQVVLEALRDHGAQRLFTVFGCGGDRDHEKRPQMGAVAALYSSHVILTSDNPRSEEPSQIILDILSGTAGFSTPIDVLLNRKYAIQYAIRMAQDGDVVLIAGKGHEQTQQIGGNVYPFCDMEEVKRAFINKNRADRDS
ncbi:UDP-N-acetylmuramoyl-L-alanyl-D-glutamate--2,6-diaminopimelate ligase [Sporosarcina obsidiansis]|uniref:UDP-N-acetylmuramoyl-L-alanyl-D-glutamate--2, 6-diaminopimelate ligase n=1 Tax=Sporosarcina obsidiansis TaxID=2660748 RepID=UPI001891EA3D|nr:UDP-N-acetylmuramoyl-L-alanyl-D-glutamate--2,6-diaminopimelate ligase [Sporosarcina obsidiansis]